MAQRAPTPAVATTVALCEQACRRTARSRSPGRVARAHNRLRGTTLLARRRHAPLHCPESFPPLSPAQGPSFTRLEQQPPKSLNVARCPYALKDPKLMLANGDGKSGTKHVSTKKQPVQMYIHICVYTCVRVQQRNARWVTQPAPSATGPWGRAGGRKIGARPSGRPACERGGGPVQKAGTSRSCNRTTLLAVVAAKCALGRLCSRRWARSVRYTAIAKAPRLNR